MNPSWLTGKMPKEQYEHEHPLHLEEAIKEEEKYVKKELKSISKAKEDTSD
jgi:hypothetical protein